MENCGACLLPVEADAQLGLIDNCIHVFHYDCVEKWSQTENSCPQCKVRFFWLASYNKKGQRCSVQRVEKKDQEGEEDEDFEDIQVCEKCKEVGDELTLLLCDGMHGTCNAAYHVGCVGLAAVPRGAWFCPDCTERGFDTDARGRRGNGSTAQVSVLSECPAVPVLALPAPKDAVPATSQGERRRGASSNSSLPTPLRLSPLACMTAPTEVPSFRPSAGQPGQASPTGLFASFVQKRRAKKGEENSAASFITLAPTYEEDFMAMGNQAKN